MEGGASGAPRGRLSGGASLGPKAAQPQNFGYEEFGRHTVGGGAPLQPHQPERHSASVVQGDQFGVLQSLVYATDGRHTFGGAAPLQPHQLDTHSPSEPQVVQLSRLQPPATQVVPEGHEGQLTAPPQPSLAVPHMMPRLAHDFGLHPQTFDVPPPPQVSGAEHDPHEIVIPQPSPIAPQFFPDPAHVFGMHGASPQTFAPPPPQIWVPGQAPQSMTSPQPSSSLPQFFFAAAHVVGMQGGSVSKIGAVSRAVSLVPLSRCASNMASRRGSSRTSSSTGEPCGAHAVSTVQVARRPSARIRFNVSAGTKAYHRAAPYRLRTRTSSL